MNGLLVQYRHRLAWLAGLFPGVARLLSGLRWWAWTATGWPFTTITLASAAGLVVVGGSRLWLPGGLFGSIWNLAATIARAWPSGVNGALTAGAVVAGVGSWLVWVRWRHNAPLAQFAAAGALGVGVVNVWATAWWLGWTLILILAIAATVLVLVDAVLPYLSRRVGLWRLWVEFRREFPAHWTDIAARSDRIQGIDVSIERSVAQGAKDRPIFEHPALGSLLVTTFDVEGFAVECPVARPEGRTFDALGQVLDEIAAQVFNVGDWAGSIRLVDVRSNAASQAVLRVEFQPSTLRRNRPTRTAPDAGVVDLEVWRGRKGVA
jgi:hypothetical protein